MGLRFFERYSILDQQPNFDIHWVKTIFQFFILANGSGRAIFINVFIFIIYSSYIVNTTILGRSWSPENVSTWHCLLKIICVELAWDEGVMKYELLELWYGDKIVNWKKIKILPYWTYFGAHKYIVQRFISFQDFWLGLNSLIKQLNQIK